MQALRSRSMTASALYRTRDIHGLGFLARRQKVRKSGKKVFYVLNRYVTPRTRCFAGCTFCSFAADEFKEPQRVFRMTADQVFAKAMETGGNFNQIHIVGGHDPRQLSLDYLAAADAALQSALPHVQLSLFTAAEIEYMAKRHRMTFPQIVSELKAAGLDNVNGGAAEIFAEPVRAENCPYKVSWDNWLALHEELHRQGVASNATMLYGHIESVEDRVDHLIRLRESQDRSPGFNAFIPLAFHPDGNELVVLRLDHRPRRYQDVCRCALDAATTSTTSKQYWMIQGLKVCPSRFAVRRRRHGRHPRFHRRRDDLSRRRHAFGTIRGRSRVPPFD